MNEIKHIQRFPHPIYRVFFTFAPACGNVEKWSDVDQYFRETFVQFGAQNRHFYLTGKKQGEWGHSEDSFPQLRAMRLKSIHILSGCCG
jgi:hypothetical protein